MEKKVKCLVKTTTKMFKFIAKYPTGKINTQK